MTGRHDSTFSRHDLSELFDFIVPLIEQRAQGKPGADCARRSGALKHTGIPCAKHMGKDYRYSRDIPAFPTQWLYGLYVLFPVSGVCCHRCLRDSSRKIDATVAAPEPHDFAVRCRRYVRRANPPDATASIATRATFRDDRDAPLMAARAGCVLPQIRIPVKRNIFACRA